MLGTVEWLRHAIAVPFVFFGLAFVVWARPIARAYRDAFGTMGRAGRRFQRGYAEPDGPAFVRLVGVAFVAIATYWAIVGTG